MDVNTPMIDLARDFARAEEDPENLGRMAQVFEDLNAPDVEADRATRFLNLLLIAVLFSGIMLLLPLIHRGIFALFDLIAHALS